MTRQDVRRLGVALETEHHLSFPFVFRYRDELYMIPESSTDRRVMLYHCTELPLRWEPLKALLEDVNAVDTMVFERDGRWWMFTTIAGSDLGPNDAELHIFYADTPFGDWKAHRLTPVIMDAAKGRNGGMVWNKKGASTALRSGPASTNMGPGSRSSASTS